MKFLLKVSLFTILLWVLKFSVEIAYNTADHRILWPGEMTTILDLLFLFSLFFITLYGLFYFSWTNKILVCVSAFVIVFCFSLPFLPFWGHFLSAKLDTISISDVGFLVVYENMAFPDHTIEVWKQKGPITYDRALVIIPDVEEAQMPIKFKLAPKQDQQQLLLQVDSQALYCFQLPYLEMC